MQLLIIKDIFISKDSYSLFNNFFSTGSKNPLSIIFQEIRCSSELGAGTNLYDKINPKKEVKKKKKPSNIGKQLIDTIYINYNHLIS